MLFKFMIMQEHTSFRCHVYHADGMTDSDGDPMVPKIKNYTNMVYLIDKEIFTRSEVNHLLLLLFGKEIKCAGDMWFFADLDYDEQVVLRLAFSNAS